MRKIFELANPISGRSGNEAIWLESIKSQQGIDLRDAKATIELASMVCKLLKVCQTFQLHHSDAIMCRIIPL